MFRHSTEQVATGHLKVPMSVQPDSAGCSSREDRKQSRFRAESEGAASWELTHLHQEQPFVMLQAQKGHYK